MRKTNSGPNAFCNLQKIFTAYVVHAVQHQRWQYLRRMDRYPLMDEWHDDLSAELSCITDKDIMAELPLLMRIENDALLYALKELTDRERDIFLSRVLDDKTFSQIAAKHGLHSRSAAMAYYRTIRKIRRLMEVLDNEL